MKSIKRYLKFISGRPKEGHVIEKVRIIPFTLHFIISITLIYYCAKYQNIFYGLMAVIFGWQAGWGMSIERFNIKENGE